MFPGGWAALSGRAEVTEDSQDLHREPAIAFLLWSNGQPKSRVGNRFIGSGWEVLRGRSAKVMDVGRGKRGHFWDLSAAAYVPSAARGVPVTELPGTLLTKVHYDAE